MEWYFFIPIIFAVIFFVIFITVFVTIIKKSKNMRKDFGVDGVDDNEIIDNIKLSISKSLNPDKYKNYCEYCGGELDGNDNKCKSCGAINKKKK